MSDYYVLDGKTPRAVAEVSEWAKFYEKESRRVAETNPTSEIRVSTVFLGLDHSFGDGPPLLFETMIFGGPHDGDMWRYSTWDEAEAGHNAAVKTSVTEKASHD